MKVTKLCIYGVVLCATVLASAQDKELIDYIKPSIGNWTKAEGGSHGGGKTYPGPVAPHGMVQLGPDCTTMDFDQAPGYSYHYDVLEGFSFARLNGAGWFGEFGNFLVTPTTGERRLNRDDAKSKFRHETETIKAGYYAVELDRYKIRTELAASERAGMLRFTYPKSQNSRIQIDLARRIGQKERWMTYSRQKVEVVDDYTIQGYMYCPYTDGGWGRGKGKSTYTMHFYAKFSQPIKSFGVWDKDTVFEKKRSYEGVNTGFFVEFPTTQGEQVLLKTGISFVSIEGAKKNLEHDIPDWDFEGVVTRTRALWSEALAGVAIEGGTEDEKTIFATGLYHALLDPRSVSDVDGWYIGADNKKHKAEGFVYRSLFSGWDVFRSEFAFLSIARPDIVNDEVNSLIQMAKLSGKGHLPRWEIMNAYSGCMVGDPAVGVIAEAYRKGIRNYDVDAAYAACHQTVMGPRTNRNHFRNYMKYGYCPGSLSTTLENAYFDHCLGIFAKELGKDDEAEQHFVRSMNYRNIWDPSVNNMRAKMKDGTWREWKGELVFKDSGCVESNPLQQGWFVPHDVQGLIDLHGGDEPFIEKLEEFFVKAEADMHDWSHYYNHANEPCHHIAYMFPYAGKPWLTQKWARTIMKKSYGTGIRGLCGNEDMGQMSAWYLLSAMGFHPVHPASGIYIIGSPIFDKVSIRLDPNYHKGKSLEVIAENNSPKNIYVQSLALNGKALERAWITHEEVTGGGTLKFVMGPRPNKSWATLKENRPPSVAQHF